MLPACPVHHPCSCHFLWPWLIWFHLYFMEKGLWLKNPINLTIFFYRSCVLVWQIHIHLYRHPYSASRSLWEPKVDTFYRNRDQSHCSSWIRGQYFILLPLPLFVRVFVADSTIRGAGQGLFAKTDAEANTVMAFYNGVRITHSEVWNTDHKQRTKVIKSI